MADHPVYIPRGSRTAASRKRPRRNNNDAHFHGAFTGGFSAGHFNTVGSREGWEPLPGGMVVSAAPAAAADEEEGDGGRTRRGIPLLPQQRPEDFMDEYDHNEWGGPVAAREEFRPRPQDSAATSAANPHMSWSVIPPQNVGHKLLRVLGWRERSATAYVPRDDDFADGDAASPTTLDREERSGPRSRWRKLRLAPAPLALPPPKLDLSGVGYEPYVNAPEFRRHKERREKLARASDRTSAAMEARNRRVYRVSDALGLDQQVPVVRPNEDENDNPYRSYEAVEDLVGQRTFGGFALRDDDDDAYDDDLGERAAPSSRAGALRVNRDEFDTELDVERASSSDGDEDGVSTDRATGGGSEDLQAAAGDVFAAWAQSAPTGGGAAIAGGSDGRPPLEGFVWASASATGPTRRYRGPDVPPDYEVTPHTFGPNEHPLVYRAMARGEQVRLYHERYQTRVAEALQSNAVVRGSGALPRAMDAGPAPSLPGRAAFAGIGAAMRSRFTSAAVTASVEEPVTEDDIGIGAPKPPIRVVRTVASFAPEPLLCKRFRVPIPDAVRGASRNVGTTSAQRTKEEAFFQDEVLGRLPTIVGSSEGAAAAEASGPSPPDVSSSLPKPPREPLQPHPGVDRPPDEAFRSIFDPDEDDAAASIPRDETHPSWPPDVVAEATAALPPSPPPPKSAKPDDMPTLPSVAPTASETSTRMGEGGDSDGERRRSQRRRRSKLKRRDERRRTSVEGSDDLSSSSSSSGARKRKRRKKEKKRHKDRRERKERKRRSGD